MIVKSDSLQINRSLSREILSCCRLFFEFLFDFEEFFLVVSGPVLDIIFDNLNGVNEFSPFCYYK